MVQNAERVVLEATYHQAKAKLGNERVHVQMEEFDDEDMDLTSPEVILAPTTCYSRILICQTSN